MPATKKAKNRRRKFSPAQLRAQAKFARMSRRMARERRAKNRRKKNASVTKAKLTVKRSANRKPTRRPSKSKRSARPAAKRNRTTPSRRAKTKKVMRRVNSRRSRSPIIRSSNRIHQRRRNQAPVGIADIHERFLGRPTDSEFSIEAPSGSVTPGPSKDLAVLGDMSAIVTETETFEFDDNEAFLGANADGDLFVLGDVRVEPHQDFGLIDELSYVAVKDHIDGEAVEYYHPFGEEGGVKPKLMSDEEGGLHIVGGSYTIEAEGITD